MLGLVQRVSVLIIRPCVCSQSTIPLTQPTVAPRVSRNNNATVIIEENDDAHGIVEFAASEFNGTEGESNFIYVRRTAGTFGEVGIIAAVFSATFITHVF